MKSGRSIWMFILFAVMIYDAHSIRQTQGEGPEVNQIIDSISNPIDRINAIQSFILTKLNSDPKYAEQLSRKMIEWSEKQDYQLGLANGYYNIGLISQYGPYPKAIENLLKAYDIYKELNRLDEQANVYISLALVYQGMDEVDQAFKFAKEGLSMASNSGNLKTLSRAHMNLSTIYYYSEKTDSSLYHARIALNLNRKLNDEYEVRHMLLNIGVFLAEYDSLLDDGLAHLLEARELSKEDPLMINDITANMIYLYRRKKDYQMARIYLDSALIGNDSIENDYTLRGIHRIAKEMFLQIEDYENAFDQLNKEYLLDSKLRGIEVKEKFEILELESENEKKQRQILLLEKEHANTNLKYIVSILLATFFIILFLFVLFNYRSKKKSLELLKKKNREINHKSKQLEIQNKEIEQFAYVVSHDLKEPLNTISGYIQALSVSKGELDEKSRQFISYISSSAKRMGQLINGLLEHSNLGQNVKFTKVDCNELLGMLQKDLSRLISETKAVIDSDKLPVVHGHKIGLSLLFQNLITNAIKFRIEDVPPRIKISSSKTKSGRSSKWKFSIRDNGIGIPNQHKERVFGMFERLHTREDYAGSGIGLSHCKKVVDLHGGDIWIESREGEGSTFYFTLPVSKN